MVNDWNNWGRGKIYVFVTWPGAKGFIVGSLQLLAVATVILELNPVQGSLFDARKALSSTRRKTGSRYPGWQ